MMKLSLLAFVLALAAPGGGGDGGWINVPDHQLTITQTFQTSPDELAVMFSDESVLFLGIGIGVLPTTDGWLGDSEGTQAERVFTALATSSVGSSEAQGPIMGMPIVGPSVEGFTTKWKNAQGREHTVFTLIQGDSLSALRRAADKHKARCDALERIYPPV